MKDRTGHIALAGVVVIVFVVLVGALGYTYLVSRNSTVANNTPQTLQAPAIAKTADLDKASSVLDSASLDDDLNTLDSVANQL